MHRFRSWTLDPPEWRTQRNRLLPAEGGDGSTLSLDFTTGVLDPRLTFTRGSNATFINSSGLVEYAPANRLANSVWSGAGGSTYPTSWGGSISVPAGQTAAGFLTLSGETIRFTSATGASGAFRTWIAQVPTIESGLTHTLSVQVVGRNANASMPLSEILGYSGTSTSLKYYINGSDVLPPERGGGAITSATTAWQAGDLLSLVVVGAINTGSIRCGYGVLGGGGQTWSNEWVELTSPQWQPGAVPSRGVYWRNPSTIAQLFDSPRFDYDPTTRTPRGLLIEGSSINYMLESTSLSGYSNSNMVAVSSGSENDPEGNANSAKQIYATSGASAYRGYYRLTTAGTNTQITLSIWAKARNYNFLFLSDLSTGRAAVRFNLNTGATDNNFGPGFVSAKATQFQNGWWRCEMVVNVIASTSYGWAFVGMPSGAVLDQFGAKYAGTGNSADGIYCYGFQVEGGSGASSYIPTGSSQGNRAADSAVMNDIGPLNYSTTNGTIYWSGIFNKQPTNYITLIGFMTAIDQPAYETFGNALNYFTAARGPTLNIGGANEVSRPYVLGSLIKYASSVNTLQDPIVAVNLNGSAGSTNKSGTGDLRVATRFVIGRQPSSTYGVEYPSVTIRSIKYWPTSKVAAELAVLTA